MIVAYPTSTYGDVCALALELYEKAEGANWNRIGYVRALRLLAAQIEAICAARMLDLEFSDAGMDNQGCSGANLEAQRTSKKSGLEQRTTSSGSLWRRDIPARHRPRKKVATVGTK